MQTEYIPKEESRPMWGQVVSRVVERFENESYGFTMYHAELKELMAIFPATTIEESKKEQLDYMTGIEKARDTLLEDYNLCLYCVRGEGYMVLHPNDQIKKGADYYIRKSQKALSRTMATLANVDSEQLDLDATNLRLAKMNRIAFIKAAFRKRKIPAPEIKKQIE